MKCLLVLLIVLSSNIINSFTPTPTTFCHTSSLSATQGFGKPKKASPTPVASSDSLSLSGLESIFASAQVAFSGTSAPSSDPSAPSKDDVWSALLKTRLASLPLKRVEARPSSVHNVGVFALRDCLPGELLSCYPGDALLVFDSGEDGITTVNATRNAAMSVLLGDHCPDRTATGCFVARDPSHRDYEVRAVGSRFSSIGDPLQSGDCAYIGASPLLLASPSLFRSLFCPFFLPIAFYYL